METNTGNRTGNSGPHGFTRPPQPLPLPTAENDANPGSEGVYRSGPGVTQPSLISPVEPEYSDEARQASHNGIVLLSFVIDENGTPRDIKILRATGFGLDEKAIEAVSEWRFRPGLHEGNPVRVKAQAEVVFRLLDKK